MDKVSSQKDVKIVVTDIKNTLNTPSNHNEPKESNASKIRLEDHHNAQEPNHGTATALTKSGNTSNNPGNIQRSINQGAAGVKKHRFELELDFAFNEINHLKPRIRRPVIRYKATQPPKSTNKLRELREKINKIDEAYELICEICNTPFGTHVSLKNHKHQAHFKASTFICALCSATFDSNDKLIEHKITHKDENRHFLCMECETAFSDHLEYLKHKATHEKSSGYYCIECGKEFNYRKGYNTHIEKHYGEFVDCDVCHRKFKSYRIKEHMKTHTEKKIKCVECGKEVNKTYMASHMINHTGVKLFQCLYCGKGFQNMQARVIHTRIHTGETPFVCKVCHRAFKQHTGLNRHMVKYHQAKTTKRLECTVCSKMFTRKYILAEHMDNHYNTQKYECHICGKKINTMTGLKSHVFRAHTEDKYKCLLCGADHKVWRDYRRHLKSKKHLNNQFGYDKRMKENECE